MNAPTGVDDEPITIKVLLVDDQPGVRQGLRLRLALEPDLRVVGEAGDGHTALALAQALTPDVVVMNVEMPGMDGVAATGRLKRLTPQLAVVIHSLSDDADTRRRAFEAGAVAVVSKTQGVEALLAAIRRVVGCSASVPSSGSNPTFDQ